jgi:hypothetical protein
MSDRKKLKSGGHKHNRVDWIVGHGLRRIHKFMGYLCHSCHFKKAFLPFPRSNTFHIISPGRCPVFIFRNQSSVYQTYAQLFHQVGDLNSWIIKHTIGIYTLNFGRQAVSSHWVCWKKMPETSSTRFNLTMAFNGSNALPCPRDYHWERGPRRWHKRSKGSPRKLARCRSAGFLGSDQYQRLFKTQELLVMNHPNHPNHPRYPILPLIHPASFWASQRWFWCHEKASNCWVQIMFSHWLILLPLMSTLA